jgi:hypothetical protein
MRDIYRTIEHLERRPFRTLDRPSSSNTAPPRENYKPKRPKVYAWRAPAGDTSDAEENKRSLQGKLKGNEIVECGITAQVKAVKETKGAAE